MLVLPSLDIPPERQIFDPGFALRNGKSMVNAPQHCPYCGSAHYYSGTCLDDQCTEPRKVAERARRRAATEDKLRRQQAAADAKARKAAAAKNRGTKGASPADTPNGLDTTGKWMAAAAALIAAAYGHRSSPDEPVVWLIMAVLAAALTWWLRKLVIVGVAVLGVLWIVTQGQKKAEPVPTSESGSLPVAQPVQTAHQPGDDPAVTLYFAEGFCIDNQTGHDLTYRILHRDTPAKDFQLGPGQERMHSRPSSRDDKPAQNVRISLSPDNSTFSVEGAVLSAPQPDSDAMLDAHGCGAPGFPSFEVTGIAPGAPIFRR